MSGDDEGETAMRRAGGMTPEEARRTLARVHQEAVATQSDRYRLRRSLTRIAAVVGALAVLLGPAAGGPDWFRQAGFGAALMLYPAVIIDVVLARRRTRAAPSGFTSRYAVGVFGTMFVYSVFLVVLAGTDGIGVVWAVLAAVVTAAPAVAAARSVDRLQPH
ncbi:putative protein OS=Tsukamurella paurometabola (strain ATCC 8368 / DSM / CCUG 35730 /CIP 100753 / JCM 10117 / KCTC 9821 / NBRC 16120 / NCIMB 702349/ NCTC 13040) OX=521096 GN=Tpau_1166 PE=4 SV=1 [Tsukamurella paurometabola]|uniref:Uncharacterized protein n=1 Tax=Tsukamurella paurometabola (strain ATCC 8368 / DSM 20162 / CCUG 35730 / CIP 100753 / JCM 10117 / KCTC 9821 / NBRC 16120 / NCIMB 702349 / NCTC 13040) TaxID=521096 RepID=D5UVZ0_TSUPD|nr:hypothetical protein [Tsukamurella paurometabola]ADG77797.1 hypothetical protein Tpau_1166 [Tsukamurella paurometabola DSM 20162]SUP28791.1 Uncharacterised protein [Tsukamurella paurometabola]